jgi:acetyl esterase/lipase
LRKRIEGPIFVAGDSSGGGLAIALLLELRDKGDQEPVAACLFSPWTDFAVTGASMTVNRERDPMQVPGCLRMLAAAYAGPADPRTPLLSPIYGDLTGLPPLAIFVGGDEILLDDSKRLAERARIGGVVADLEGAAVHMGQGIANHTVDILGAAGHLRENEEHGEQEDQENGDCPFPEGHG